jgi:hypothetical protein
MGSIGGIEGCIGEGLIQLFLKAAHGGNVRAQLSIANLSRDGSGIEQSYRNAAEWYNKIINTVLPDGTGDITKLLDLQQTQDFQQCVNSAHHELGFLHLRGHNFPQDFSTAIEHLTRAANGGFLPSQKELGLLLLANNSKSLHLQSHMLLMPLKITLKRSNNNRLAGR